VVNTTKEIGIGSNWDHSLRIDPDGNVSLLRNTKIQPYGDGDAKIYFDGQAEYAKYAQYDMSGEAIMTKYFAGVNYDAKTLQFTNANNGQITDLSLPFLYCNEDDTFTGHLTISGGSGGSNNLTIYDDSGWPIIGLKNDIRSYWIEVPYEDATNSGASNEDLYIGCYSNAIRISPDGALKLHPGESIMPY
jgi:hypothetical protein